MLLMNPTNYQTDTVNAALNWTGEKGRLSLGYFGSFFSDKNNDLSWSNPFTANNGTGRASATGTAAPNGFPVSTMSTTPDNQFNQVNLTGGYDFSPATKLAGGLSYGRNTQDDSFLTNMMPSGLPRSSLDGEVITKNANLKLTNQATKELALTAGFKYNERDNKTSSKSYDFTLVDGAGAPDDATNIPFSNKRYQFELAGDYRFNSSNNLRLAYEYNRIKRWCSDTGPDCVKAEDNTDNTVGLEYRLKASDTVSFNAGYSYADRNANNNSDLNWESTIGANDLNVSGFVPYFEASRKEQIAKAGVNWQATDRLDLGLTGRYIYDNYDEKLGLQNSDTWSLNLDATFSYSENGSVSAYASLMKRWRDMKNASAGNIEATPVLPPSNLWTNRLSDDEDAFGLSAKHKGLMGGKLSLAGDVSYVYGNSGYTTNLDYTPSTLCTSSVSGATNFNLACGSTPDITNRMLQVKLSGDYQVDKHSKIALGYLYQQLHSNDYYYNGYQTGYTSSTLLPTNEQEQSYSVNVVTATYTYEF
jgi:MtrB/PioB family decaheme-associated outer membrane protein